MYMQIILCIVGVLVVLSAFIPQIKDFISALKSKESELPSEYKSIEREVVEVSPVEKVKPTFAELVSEWESFVNILLENDMSECAEDMKALLVKMAKEYRQDLNDYDIEIVAKDSKTSEEGNIADILVVEEA